MLQIDILKMLQSRPEAMQLVGVFEVRYMATHPEQCCGTAVRCVSYSLLAC